MSRTHISAALVAATLIAVPAAAASAQEAITLETIGAVRMATPAEMRDGQPVPAATDRGRQHDAALVDAAPTSAR